MQEIPFKTRHLVDYLYDFSKGVNNGISYALIPKDQLSSGVNTTVRGSFVGPRPCWRKITLAGIDYGDDAMIAILEAGRFQGACVYNPDNGTDSLMASISGHLYRFAIGATSAAVSDVSIAGDLNDATQMRNWLWQAEKWIVVTDGTVKAPLFYTSEPDGVDPTTRRSNGTSVITYSATIATTFTVPDIGVAIGGASDIAINLSIDPTGTINIGDTVNISPVGAFIVTDVGLNHVHLTNFNAQPVGAVVAVGNTITWTAAGNELPAGRMGVYGMGRVWMSLVDGKQFTASDLVGGSSGTVAYNFRNSVLNVTENNYLLGGGNFAVPGPYGEIRAMVFAETLDSSLGQGALQVFTPSTVFSCNAPVDRATWQNLTNPILTESAKGGGGLSQWSTVNWNSDILSRAKDGIRSLLLTRREFNTWGNVPISREIQPQLDRDSDSLLGYSSAAVFDNRHLETAEPELVENRGVIWKRLTAINADPTSSLQGKAPSVYDALYWSGLNIFQILKGDFAGVERCFAFTLNQITDKIELWELLKSSNPAIYDDVDTRIVWSIESPMIDFGQKDPRLRERLRLGQSEISVNELRGKVSFQAYYRPEFYPCWIPWGAWEECSINENASETSPSFRPNMGLPEPDPDWCDETNNRPLREGYFFQVKLVVTGHCKITSWKFTADTVPQPPIAPPSCESICPP